MFRTHVRYLADQTSLPDTKKQLSSRLGALSSVFSGMNEDTGSGEARALFFTQRSVPTYNRFLVVSARCYSGHHGSDSEQNRHNPCLGGALPSSRGRKTIQKCIMCSVVTF